MNPNPLPPRPPRAQWIEREQYLERFEAARAADPHVALARFLPPIEDPLFIPVLEELIRIDLEHHWLNGSPRMLEDYILEFPMLSELSASIRTLAFEEFRLRRKIGESPTTEEYRARFGIDPARGTRDDRLELVPGPKTPSPGTDRFAQVMAALPQVGDRYLDYLLLAVLGEGAYGRVFLAERGGRRVALKVGPALATEPQIHFNHRNIVPVEEEFHVGSYRAIVMPYLGSLTLAHLLKNLAWQPAAPTRGFALFQTHRPGFPPGNRAASDARLKPVLESVSYAEAVGWIGLQIAAALVHAHELGTLHLDLKPANILFTDDGRPMLLDFHALSRDPSGAPVVGTIPYMAPEQLQGFLQKRATVDARSDLFSLGVILYQFFTGKLPFGDLAANSPADLERALENRATPPATIAELNPAIPPRLARQVESLLTRDPAGRPESAREFITSMRSCFKGFPLRLPRGLPWWKRWKTDV